MDAQATVPDRPLKHSPNLERVAQQLKAARVAWLERGSSAELKQRLSFIMGELMREGGR